VKRLIGRLQKEEREQRGTKGTEIMKKEIKKGEGVRAWSNWP
jgi:hypothetical protein